MEYIREVFASEDWFTMGVFPIVFCGVMLIITILYYKVSKVQKKAVESLSIMGELLSKLTVQQERVLDQFQQQFILGKFIEALPPAEKARLVNAIINTCKEHPDQDASQKDLIKDIMEEFRQPEKKENLARVKDGFIR